MADHCDNMADNIAQMIDGVLAPGRVDKVKGHLENCPGCGDYYDGLVRDSRNLAAFVGSLDEVVARIETQGTEKLNTNSHKQCVKLRRQTMRKDFMKMTLAAAVIIIAAIIGRGYFMSRDKSNDDFIAKYPPKTVEPQVATNNAQDIVAIPNALGTPGEGMASLPIELPKPMFGGTRTNIKVANLEKLSGKARAPFYAPVGCVNLAAGKVVSSTDELPIIGEIEMITDGDKEAADGSYIELGPFQQHITIDLEKECEIYAVLVWHYHKQKRVYFDVIVQAADDADFITNVKTLFNNDIDNTAGLGIGTDMHYIETSEGRLVDGKGTRARYVRLYSNGWNAGDLNNYIEVEVWGKPASSFYNAWQNETWHGHPGGTGILPVYHGQDAHAT